MNENMKKMAVVCAVLAFAFCLGAGVWILTKTRFAHGNDALSTGLGLYFIGKAFFVGPMLLLTARILRP